MKRILIIAIAAGLIMSGCVGAPGHFRLETPLGKMEAGMTQMHTNR